ncbi:portal protein [Bartonella tamiae]|uniref:portal protein n=1 Tax=Bartonella tamiae TaxID=373638 RepID=UPI00026E77AD|nr:portal protein [Bartonella tamiae]EJF92652.1 hypothetical protein MEG_01822 [Bartonella tamiae Th307]
MVDNKTDENIDNQAADEKSNLDDLTTKFKRWFREDIAHVSSWREEAVEDFAFYNGNQWNSEDLAVLKEQRRPVMTFNRVAPLVNAVIGAERNNKREVRYIPREIGDAQANEILTGAGEWFRDQASAEDEDSDAFTDAVICGMGWTDTRLDFESNPDGDPIIERLDPLKMVWDCNATKVNLKDARRLWYVDKKPLEEVKELFPNVDEDDLNAGWVENDDSHEQHLNDNDTLYQNSDEVSQTSRKMVTIVECRWFEREIYYRGIDPMTGQKKEYAKQEIDDILTQVPNFPHAKQTRKIVKRVFIGRRILDKPDRPLTPPNQFGWECVTGYFDKEKSHFYGVVKATKDPQRWSNKFFSQVMFLLNSQSKGGLLAERGAFDNDRQAEESWAKADVITWVKNGYLKSGGIQPKPASQFPAGFFQLFNEAKEALTQVTGLSAEFIGTREVNQAGVLESQRRQSSLNLLAQLFDNLKTYRKRQGQIVLYLIQNFLSDGRLIRIVGENKQQYVPLTREAVANIQYDIIVDDAPTSPNEKERTFAIIQQLLPVMKEYLTPEMGLEILRYSPLPASMVDKLQQEVERKKQEQSQQQQQPDPNAQMHQMKMAEMQASLQAKHETQNIELQGKSIDLYLKQREAELEMQKQDKKNRLEQERLAVEAVTNSIRQQNANTARAKF